MYFQSCPKNCPQNRPWNCPKNCSWKCPWNCLSQVQKVEAGAAKTHPIEWNSVPLSVICAFPYILAFSTDAIEFRYAVNGSLLQTLCLPELKLISAKVSLLLVLTLISCVHLKISKKILIFFWFFQDIFVHKKIGIF